MLTTSSEQSDTYDEKKHGETLADIDGSISNESSEASINASGVNTNSNQLDINPEPEAVLTINDIVDAIIIHQRRERIRRSNARGFFSRCKRSFGFFFIGIATAVTGIASLYQMYLLHTRQTVANIRVDF